MRTLITLVILIFTGTLLEARSAPDSLAVAKLYNTSWTLTKKYRFGKGAFHSKRKVKNPDESFITIYKDEIQTNLLGGALLVCASRHRNQNEFWLDCAKSDQYIYRVIRIHESELIMDILTRLQGQSGYVRVSRNYYTRK